MIEVECLVCGKTIQITQLIDTEDYDGQIACRECDSLLHIKLVGSKVKSCELVEKNFGGLTGDGKTPEGKVGPEPEPARPAVEKVDVEAVARYNPLRDFLASYHASKLLLGFERIETLIGGEMEPAAYTFKSWWENNPAHPQAMAWLETGWRVMDVDLPQRRVIFNRALEDADH